MSNVIDVILFKALVVNVTNSKKKQCIRTKHWLLTFFCSNLLWANMRCTASYFIWECKTTILEITILVQWKPTPASILICSSFSNFINELYKTSMEFIVNTVYYAKYHYWTIAGDFERILNELEKKELWRAENSLKEKQKWSECGLTPVYTKRYCRFIENWLLTICVRAAR